MEVELGPGVCEEVHGLVWGSSEGDGCRPTREGIFAVQTWVKLG